MRKFFSWLLLCAGLCLLVLGARELLEPWLAQSDAEVTWERPEEAPAAARPSLELGDTLARLAIPRLDSEWFVIEGAGKKQLRRGPGHLRGTALPGEAGNCVIAGHRDTQFRALKDLRTGDEIVVETARGEYRYRVTDLTVVSPKNTEALEPTREAVLNLITCYPFYYVGPAPKRFVVRAELAHGGGIQNTELRTPNARGF